MGRLKVALLCTAPPNAITSMGLYRDVVCEALAKYAPDLELMPVSLRGSNGGAPSGRWRERAHLLGQTVAARWRAGQFKATVYHVLDGSRGYMIGGIPWARVLVTVHDMVPVLQARGRFAAPRPSWASRRLIEASLRCIRRAGAVHAVSENTASDVQTLTGRRADAVILNPLRPLPGGLPAMERAGDDPPFILHVGNNSYYKNRRGVLEVFAQVAQARPDVRLVLAGPAPDRELREIAALHGAASRVQFVVDPDDRQLADLYQQAKLLLFPSVYEGFGWPVLEAMHYRCPVVCSRAGSLPEVVADSAVLCEPADTCGLAEAALRVLSDGRLAEQLVENGMRNLRRFESRPLAIGLERLYEHLAANRQ